MVRLTFGFNLPSTLSVGDDIFYVNEDGGAELLGPATIVELNELTVDADPTTVRPDIGQFILFAPNRSVEQSGLIGYEGTCVFVNDSTKRAELFAVSAEVFESSR